jgi:(p)ppGpp synthase/HD superfamily hydrolase
MRELTRRAHSAQTRNAGRLPYWVHTDAVADICDHALRLTGELPPDQAEDVVLAAYGHDLYEDTEYPAANIRAEFGDRVDGWIDGMSNREGDNDRAEYMRHLAGSDDETRVIKCADLIDNMLSVTYGLHDLGLTWAREYFLPIADETRAVLLSTPFTRLPRTGAYLSTLVDWARSRLAASMGTAAAIADQKMGEAKELSPAARAMVER